MKSKLFIKIYRWVVVSIIFQVLLLFFFNNIYISGRGEATVTPETKEQPGLLKKTISVSIPANAQNPKVSFDNSYVSYLSDGKLEIYDVKNSKTVKTISTKKDIITAYRWLPDRNMVIYSIKAPKEEAGAVQVITYNMDSDVQHDYPRITGLPKNSEVVAIELSHLTNSVYAKVQTSETEARIYRYNVMSQLYHITNVTVDTVIKEMHYKDKLVYQDGKYRINIYTWKEPKGTSAAMPFQNKMALLGIIGTDDEIYLGELNSENKISGIIYGKSEDDPKTWKSIQVKRQVSPDKIVMTPEGKLYELQEDKKKLYDIVENEEISYSGKFIEITDLHLVSQEAGELKIKEL